MTETRNRPAQSRDGLPATGEYLEKLRKALARDGDFPASARVVNELLECATNPNTTADHISEVILKETSLSTRVLHLVNSSFYNRGRPIMTVSHAVVRLGIKILTDLCSSLVLLQKFVPTARSDSAFAASLKQAILTSLIASSLAKQLDRTAEDKDLETGYLAGCFAGLGLLISAYYFPNINELMLKKMREEGHDVETSIKQITGFRPLELSLEIIRSLGLPVFYEEVLKSAAGIPENLSDPAKRPGVLARAVYLAVRLSETIVFGENRSELVERIKDLTTTFEISEATLVSVISELPAIYNEHCNSLELHISPLPEFVLTFDSVGPTEGPSLDTVKTTGVSAGIKEILEAIKNGEPSTSIMLSAMETIAWSLGFDRVLLLLPAAGKKQLTGTNFIGQNGPNPASFTRSLELPATEENPDMLAMKESKVVFCGQPLLRGAEIFAVLPVGYGERARGVIYADRPGSTVVISPSEQAVLKTLADLVDQSIRATP
jgi:hypothetical protein